VQCKEIIMAKKKEKAEPKPVEEVIRREIHKATQQFRK